MCPDALDKLVIDTLYCRRTIPNTCFVTNLAAQELEQQSEEALPTIERVLTNIVIGNASDVDRANSFLGLDHLLRAYMFIGSRHDVRRMVAFLRALPISLQAKAIGLIPLCFRKEECRDVERPSNDLKPPPDKQLLSSVAQSANASDETLSRRAAWALSFYPSVALWSTFRSEM